MEDDPKVSWILGMIFSMYTASAHYPAASTDATKDYGQTIHLAWTLYVLLTFRWYSHHSHLEDVILK